jgi:putative ABC transport system permease protein
MTLTHIAIQNLRRRTGKTIFLILTFFLVVSTITTLNVLSLGLKQDLQKSLSQYGANVVISPRSEHLNLSYGGLSVSGVKYEVKKLNSHVPEIISQQLGLDVTIAPKVIGSADTKDKRYMIIGIDFAEELKIKPWWKIDGDIPKEKQVVLGSRLVAQTGLKKGDQIDFSQGKYAVVGVMAETGGSEDNGVFTTIQSARTLTGIKTDWSLIELNTQDSAKTVSQLTPALPEANVTEVTQLVQGSKESVERFSSFSWSMSLALSLIGVLVIFVTLAGNVNDRARELGVLRAIGFRQKHILSLLSQEAIIVSIGGSLIGYFAGLFLPLFLGPLLIQNSVPFAFHLRLGSASVLGSLGVGLAAMIYPAWRTLKLDLQEALRFI